MNRTDGFVTDEQKATQIPATLAKWYAAHSSIRRLRAMEDQNALVVFLALEPTLDGGDTLPIWLAHHGRWARDLRSLMNREVHVRLIASGSLDASPDAAVIAELDWRESWISP
jgi:hypothetical protein